MFINPTSKRNTLLEGVQRAPRSLIDSVQYPANHSTGGHASAKAALAAAKSFDTNLHGVRSNLPY